MDELPRVVLLLYAHAGYDRAILQGVIRYARIHGPWIFYVAGEDPGLPLPDTEAISGAPIRMIGAGEGNRRMHLPDLSRWGATGIIGRLQNREILKMAVESGAPLIAMDLSDEQLASDLPLKDVSEIRPDSVKAGRMAAEHLLERGFVNFAFCGYDGRSWSQRRQEGFAERVREAGLQCRVFRLDSKKSVLWQTERDYVTDWLRGLPKPVGIMACNDVRGRQVLEACLVVQIAVPDQVAVIGVDNDELFCELSNPPLSSVVLDAEQGGYEAAKLLDRLMSSRKTPHARIGVEPLWVTARQSTDLIAVDDPEVAAALRFIRDHAREQIGVEDVVRKAAISRRMLEIRFSHVLGRSIREEIQRVRLTWVKQLLLETRMPVAKITTLAGFSSLTHLSKVFRRETGETLSHYRRRHRPA